MNLLDLFDLSFVGRRDSIALEFGAGEPQPATYTFGDLDRRSNRMAGLFESRGLKEGDRLCVYLVNCCEMIDIYLACLKLGVILVPINILYREREITHILTDADPRAVIAAEPLPGEVPFWLVQELARAAADFPAEFRRVALDGDAAAAIVYTSGTTGVSKGAILTHNNFAANALNLLTCWQISSEDRFLLSLPLFHVHGLGNGLHCWLISGCRTRLLERFDSRKATEIFLDFRPTLFFGVPTIYVRLLETPPQNASEIGGFVRLFVSGSAPLPAQVLEEFHRRFGPYDSRAVRIDRNTHEYQQSLCGGKARGDCRSASAGRFGPPARQGRQPRTRWGDGRSLCSGPQCVCRLLEARRRDTSRLRGTVTSGPATWPCERSDGYYTLSGRKSDLIISGGFNIYPREIEEFLQEQDEVTEAAVAGVPDRLRGQVPVAYIVPKGDFDPAALESRCRKNLASFKVPRAFYRVESLPRTALGKVQKHLLPKRKLDHVENK